MKSNTNRNRRPQQSVAGPNKNTGGRRKRALAIQIVLLLLVLTAIIAVLFLLFKDRPEKPDGKDSSLHQFSKSPESSQSESHAGSQPESEDPTSSSPEEPARPTPEAVFWGENINLSPAVSATGSSPSSQKWPSEAGFAIPSHDLSLFRKNKNISRPLEGAVIFLDPGHGGEDLGAVFPPPNTTRPVIMEKEVALDVALKMKDILEEQGAEVILTRDNNKEDYSSYYRYGLVGEYILSDFAEKLSPNSNNRSIINGYIGEMRKTMERNKDSHPDDIFYPNGADMKIKNILDIQRGYPHAIFISLHCNSNTVENSEHGTTVYYATDYSVFELRGSIGSNVNKPEYQFYDNENRARLAGLIYNQIVADIPDLAFYNPQRALQLQNYGVLRRINLVNVLVEMAFVNHEGDRALLMSEEGRAEIAGSIAKAVKSYYCD